MSDHATPQPPSMPELQARLQGVAKLLRESQTIDPGARADLTTLVDELGKALESGQVPPDELAHMVDSAAHVAESLHHEHEPAHLGTLRERLEQTVLAAEARAPFLTGLAHRFLEMLTNLGI